MVANFNRIWNRTESCKIQSYTSAQVKISKDRTEMAFCPFRDLKRQSRIWGDGVGHGTVSTGFAGNWPFFLLLLTGKAPFCVHMGGHCARKGCSCTLCWGHCTGSEKGEFPDHVLWFWRGCGRLVGWGLVGQKDLSHSAYMATGHNVKFSSNFCFAVDSFHFLKEKSVFSKGFV